jgi:hypothetical protein
MKKCHSANSAERPSLHQEFTLFPKQDFTINLTSLERHLNVTTNLLAYQRVSLCRACISQSIIDMILGTCITLHFHFCWHWCRTISPLQNVCVSITLGTIYFTYLCPWFQSKWLRQCQSNLQKIHGYSYFGGINLFKFLIHNA